jgi:hypothetical protein
MFKLENDGAYIGLQAPISIDESIQPIAFVRGFTIAASDLVADVPNGRDQNDGVDTNEEYAISTLVMIVSISICPNVKTI